ncbi:hypothetical protein [Fibrisoma montanum]|uniref:hypothetical protein n=1 Tax=Fibrisoma montanum TaxID=2305895 RepID=UPI0018F2DBB9|nr:hypothetical protein [Fibrisoma montanum]
MKIARQHFTEFEQFVSDHIRDAYAVNLSRYNYGLLPSDSPDFSVQVITDPNQNIRIQLTNCRAVTGSGCRIELVNASVELSTSLNQVLTKFGMPAADELHFLIVLTVDLFNRQPTGIPSATEGFPRPPFSRPTYSISVVPSHQYYSPINNRPSYRSADFESYHLIIGQLSCQHGQLRNDEQYIPACSSIESHTRLQAWADQTNRLLSEAQRDAFIIVRKVCEKRGSEDARKAGVLAELIRDLCEQLAIGLDDPLNRFGLTAYEQPPIYLIEAITLTTRRLRTSLMNLNNPATSGAVRMGDQLVLKYFQDWTDISPERLTKQGLERVVNYAYDHGNIQPHLQTITQCWSDIAKILNELSKLDYIGQERQDKRIRYDSVVTSPENLPNRPPSAILDDTSTGTMRRRFTGDR